jgi:hypothetical protein
VLQEQHNKDEVIEATAALWRLSTEERTANKHPGPDTSRKSQLTSTQSDATIVDLVWGQKIADADTKYEAVDLIMKTINERLSAQVGTNLRLVPRLKLIHS